MRVSVLEPWRALYEGNVEEVILPGDDGELCVLDFHHPLLHRLGRGVIQMKHRGAPAAPIRIAIVDGVARMSGNELVILVETR